MPDRDVARLATRKDFGAALTQVRRAAGLSIREVARRAGVTPGTISGWFAGNAVPSPDEGLRDLQAVLRACGVADEPIAQWKAAADRIRATTRPARPGHCPYRGLEPYRSADAAEFFGRADLVAMLQNRVEAGLSGAAPAVVGVLGSSGSGKSSLLQAGLMPRLTTPAVLVTPGADPLHRLDQAVGAADCGTGLVIVVDQAEELWTHETLVGSDTDRPLRDRFLHRLDTMTTDLPVVVVFSLRADFFDRAAQYPMLVPALTTGAVLVGPMNEEQLRAAITEPASTAGGVVHPTLVELLLQELAVTTAGGAHDPGALPLLSHAMYRSWTQRTTASDKLTIEQYRRTGGIYGAIKQSADEVWLALESDPTAAEATRRIFTRAVLIGDTGLARRVVAATELEWDDIDAGVVHAVVDRYIAARLLTTTADGVQISHEALMTSWPRLVAWIDDDRDSIVKYRRLATAAAEWDLDRNDSTLLTAGKTEEFREWSGHAANATQLTPTERAFLDESIRFHAAAADRDRQRTNRLRTAVAVLLVVTAAFIAATAVAVYARNNTATSLRLADRNFRTATALRLTSEGQAMLAGSRDGGDVRALQQISAAYQLRPEIALAAMADALSRTRSLASVVPASSAVGRVAVGRNSAFLVAACSDGTIRLADARTGRRIREWLGHSGGATGVAVDPSGTRIVSSGGDGTVRLWDTTTGKELRPPLRGHYGAVWNVAFTPAGDRIASSGDDGTVRLWDTNTGKELRPPLRGHHGAVWNVAFTPAGDRIASSGDDGTVRLWDTNTGQEARAPSRAEGRVFALAVSPDGRHIISGTDAGRAYRWDTDSGRETSAWPVAHNSRITGLNFDGDGSRVLSTAGDGTIRIWDDSTGRPLGPVLTGHKGEATAAAFSRGGSQVVSGGADATIRVWDVGPGNPFGLPWLGHDGAVSGVAFSPDGSKLVSAGFDGTLRWWDATAGRELGAATHSPPEPVYKVAFSQDGSRVASVGRDGLMRLWNAATREHIGTSTGGHRGVAGSVAFNRAGNLVATGGFDGTVLLWDATSGRQVGAPLPILQGRVLGITFGPGDELVVAGDDGVVRLWDTIAGHQIGRAWRGHQGPVWGVAISRTGDAVVTGGDDGTVRVWNPRTGTETVPPLRGHSGPIWGVAIDPDSRRVVSGGSDRTVRLWNARTGEAVGGPLEGHTDLVWSVAFGPRGDEVAAAGADASISLWPTPGAWLRVLCTKLPLAISPSQWREWVSADIEYRPGCQNSGAK
ncbi:MAG: helix-turn-helix domain-containing protein [Mycobacteriaceae bacterium]|nr:helix-turn-helix domain-containing protein [Mycobacteriaceae bacterium]